MIHFRRYAIIETPWFNIYVHTIQRADEDDHLHDHPWDYLSVVLRGSFLEGYYDENGKYCMSAMGPGNISKQKAERFHKIAMLSFKTTHVKTLFFTGPRKRVWGYDVDGKWVDNQTYRFQKNLNRTELESQKKSSQTV